MLSSRVRSLHPLVGARPFNQPTDGGVLSSGYDFKAGGKISCCCLTFSATNNLCLAIHLSTSHPVSVRLSASLMDSTRANGQVVCSAATHGVRRQPFGLFLLRAQCAILQQFLLTHLTLSSFSQQHEGRRHLQDVMKASSFPA